MNDDFPITPLDGPTTITGSGSANLTFRKTATEPYLVIRPRNDSAYPWSEPPKAVQFYPALPDDVLLQFGADHFNQHVTLGEVRQWLAWRYLRGQP